MRGHRQFIAALAILLVAYASTTMRDSWYDPDYRGAPFRKVLVLGVFPSVSERRLYEDIMVAKINATGAARHPGIPIAARRRTGERRRARSRRARIRRGRVADGAASPRRYPHPSMDADVAARTRTLGLGMERVVLWLVGGWYAPTINQYNIATVETTLFSAPSRRVVWTGVTETFEPRSVARDAPAFSDAVITALQSRGLLLVAK